MKRAARLAASGLLGTVALLVLLRPDAQDPLRLTAALLPLLVAGFAALRDADGEVRASGRGTRLATLAAVAGWGVLAVGCRYLALPHAEPVVAAAGALLLAGWLVRQLPELLRRLAGAGERLPPRVFFLLPLLVSIAVLPWIQTRHVPNGDEPYNLLMVHSMAFDGDIDLADNYADGDALSFLPHPIEPQQDDPRGEGGEIYSRHSPAVPLLFFLPYRLAGRTGAALVMLVLAAATAWAGLALARELHPRRHRGQLLAWAALAFASPLAMYAYRFWNEVPAALCLTLASVLILRRRSARPPGIRYLLGMALLLGYPVLVKLRFGLVSAPLAALSWWRSGRRWKPAAAVGAVLLALGAAAVTLNVAQYGRIFGKNDPRTLDLLQYPLDRWPKAVAGTFLDGAFGLAPSSPIWLLLLPAVALTLIRRPASRGLLLVWVPYFLALLPRSNSFNQFGPPFRYAVAVLPTLAACLVPALEDRRGSVRTVARALAAVTLVLAIVWIVQPEWTVDRVTGTTHLIDRLELLTRSDVGRLFPSYQRVRTAAWVWAGVVVALSACWRWWPARPRRRGFAAPLVLLVAAAAAWTATHAPTRQVDLEDRWIEHDGGEEHPGPWDPLAQPRAWKLAPGEAVRIPAIPGGPILRPALRLRRLDDAGREVAIEISAEDGRVLATWSDELVPPHQWHWVTLPPVALPARRPVELTLRAVAPGHRDPRRQGKPGAVALDRAVFEWAPEPAAANATP